MKETSDLSSTGKVEASNDTFLVPAVKSLYSDGPYAPVKQNAATNALTKVKSAKAEKRVDALSNKATIVATDLTVVIEEYGKGRELNTSTHKLFDALMQEYTRNGANERRVTLPLKQYIEMRGLKDPKSAREQVKADLQNLYSVSLTFPKSLVTHDKSQSGEYRFRMVTDISYDRKTVSATFNETFLMLMECSPVMPYPFELFRINDRRHPNAYYLGRKITELKNMNIGKDNEDVVSVERLLAACPEIPTREEVEQSGRHFTKRIVEPFERDMDALCNIFDWEYCHENRKPLTDAEMDAFTFDIFIGLNVLIHWRTEPDADGSRHKAVEAGRRNAKRRAVYAAKKKAVTSKDRGEKT